MGSDRGPAATVGGAAQISQRPSAPDLILVGDEATIRAELAKHPHDAARVRIVHAKDVCAMDEKPKDALDARPDASISSPRVWCTRARRTSSSARATPAR